MLLNAFDPRSCNTHDIQSIVSDFLFLWHYNLVCLRIFTKNPIKSGEFVSEKVKTILRGNILSLLNQICNLGNDINEVTLQ
jgi:hypothetical protein